MTNRLSRRVFVKLASAASGAIIVGFDPLNHSWVTQAQVRTTPFQKLPKLDGVLLYDEAACLAFATDRGNLVHRRPVAVLRPGSIRDVVTMIHYANKHSLKIAMRGQGHSQYGQALVEAGVIIDSTTLNNIHSINPEVADVQCGVSLGQLATATLAKGLILPVLPDGMMLTVGGVLCVGGHGKTSHHFGAMVDQVTELDVCTGDGRLVSCSPKHQTELFDLALGGLGQYALIVRAKLRLIPAQSHIVFRRLTYDDIDALISDDIQLAKDGRYDFLSGGISHQRGGDYIRIGKFYTGPNEPDLASLEAGLKFKSKSEPERLTHSDYLDKNPGGLTARPRQAQADRPAQPNIANIAVLMPASAVRDYVAKILATPSEKVGLTLFGEPFETRRFTRPLFKVPGEDIAFAMWIYRGLRAAGGVPISTLQETNRKLLERMRAVGGKAYPPYAPYFSRVDWEEHYGSELWHRLSIAKKRFDPKNVLTPGPGIFSVKNGGTRS